MTEISERKAEIEPIRLISLLRDELSSFGLDVFGHPIPVSRLVIIHTKLRYTLHQYQYQYRL